MMARQVSRPIWSASVSGPIGWFVPRRIAVSIDSTVPTPSWSAKAASLSIGIRMRLTMKPGESVEKAAVLPRRATTACAAAMVSSLVPAPRMTSTSAIIGTGFMKCRPMNLSGRPLAAPSRVIEIEDVFVATIACGPRLLESSLRIDALTASFSVAASMTRSQAARPARSAAVSIRARASPAAAAVIVSFLTCRSRFAAIAVRAPASASGEASTIVVR